MPELIINSRNWRQHINPIVDGARMMHGLNPRNYALQPHGSLMYAKPFDLSLIDQGQWQARLDLQKQMGARLSNIRNTAYGSPIPSRDQNGKGYCWAHSGTSAHILARAAANLPYADLSAYAVACMIKSFRDEGGWAGEGVEFQSTKGIPTSQFWPQQSMDRANDNPQTWANAALHKYVEWMDLDPNQMKEQLVTCLLLGIPLACDFNWWSHSVCGMDLESLDPFRIRIWNSWGDSWSENGTGLLEGSKAIPDAALACRVVTASAA